MTGEPGRMLLVEDSAETVTLMREALRDAGVASQVDVAGDGEAAMAYLRAPATPRPDLVLLDLNLPGKSGHEVLAEIKQDAGLQPIPVVVLTTSNDPTDVSRAYASQANAYVQKPLRFEELVEVLGSIDEFWLGVATLPSV